MVSGAEPAHRRPTRYQSEASASSLRRSTSPRVFSNKVSFGTYSLGRIVDYHSLPASNRRLANNSQWAVFRIASSNNLQSQLAVAARFGSATGKGSISCALSLFVSTERSLLQCMRFTYQGWKETCSINLLNFTPPTQFLLVSIPSWRKFQIVHTT